MAGSSRFCLYVFIPTNSRIGQFRLHLRFFFFDVRLRIENLFRRCVDLFCGVDDFSFIFVPFGDYFSLLGASRLFWYIDEHNVRWCFVFGDSDLKYFTSTSKSFCFRLSFRILRSAPVTTQRSSLDLD